MGHYINIFTAFLDLTSTVANLLTFHKLLDRFDNSFKFIPFHTISTDLPTMIINLP